MGEAVELKPPRRLSIMFCPKCGRDDWAGPTLKTRHWCKGKLCNGVPVRIVYQPATDPDPVRDVLVAGLNHCLNEKHSGLVVECSFCDAARAALKSAQGEGNGK